MDGTASGTWQVPPERLVRQDEGSHCLTPFAAFIMIIKRFVQLDRTRLILYLLDAFIDLKRPVEKVRLNADAPERVPSFTSLSFSIFAPLKIFK